MKSGHQFFAAAIALLIFFAGLGAGLVVMRLRGSGPGTAAAPAAGPEFGPSDKLRYRAALEKMRYELKAGPGAEPFAAAVSPDWIAEQVKTDEKKERLLRDYCRLQITPEMINRELDRMKDEYQRPELVLRIAEALDNDPRAIVEFWVRPILVDRYLRACVAVDPDINDPARDQAQEIASRLPAGATADAPVLPRVTLRLSDPELAPEDREALLKLEPGKTSPVIESITDFHVFRLSSRTGDTVEAEMAQVPKPEFETWFESRP